MNAIVRFSISVFPTPICSFKVMEGLPDFHSESALLSNPCSYVVLQAAFRDLQ